MGPRAKVRALKWRRHWQDDIGMRGQFLGTGQTGQDADGLHAGGGGDVPQRRDLAHGGGHGHVALAGVHDEAVDAVETILNTYLAKREDGERFLDTYRRVGMDPFKAALYD